MLDSRVVKGLLLSAIVFVAYTLSIAISGHLFRIQRYSRWFLGWFAAWSVGYVLLYRLSPADLWILPPRWARAPAGLDLFYGWLVLGLNMHNLLDFFFGVNGGFSTCLLLEIWRAGPQGLRTADLVARFRRPDGTDKIYGWRLPGLARSGYIELCPSTGMCRLTRKGLWVARIAWFAKKLLSLGLGG